MRRILPIAPAVVLSLALLAACDLPTEAPIIDQRWVVPVDNSTISVNELLPDGVSAQNGSFAVDVDPFNRTERLGTMCSSCQASDGLTVPKPAFDYTITVEQSLPGDVQSAALESGAVLIQIANNLGFDPLRPGGGNTGSLVIRVRNGTGGAVLGTLTMDGANESLATGTIAQKTLTLGAADVGSTLTLEVAVDSPDGDPVQVDADATLTATASPADILVGSAMVEVAGRDVEIDPVELDVADIDDGIANRIQEGSILLDVTNPFGVAVSGQLVIEYPGGEISKTLSIGSAATSTVSLPYTGDELRAFLGESGVQLTGTATVDAGSGSITVSPGQELAIDGKLDVTIRIGD
jgi:hypothetical protein